MSPEYTMGDTGKLFTPKGLSEIGIVGLKLPLYISNYKGGRNESFMYGINDGFHIYDYDLKGAYTTAMAAMGSPNYSLAYSYTDEQCDKLRRTAKEKLDFGELVWSYTVFRVVFKFPEGTRYPSIPCNIDPTITVYPLAGEAVITGSEYYLARLQGCDIEISEGFSIPFVGCSGNDWLKTLNYNKRAAYYGGYEDEDRKVINNFGRTPYTQVIRELQGSRAKHKAGSFLNKMYKQLGNGIYGTVARGIGGKSKRDIQSGVLTRMGPSKLSNAILASWTTSYIRSVIGENLHNINQLGGEVVSVTTDGYITNIADLEDKLVGSDSRLFESFKGIRSLLTGDENSPGLEVKSCGVGIYS